MKNSQVTVRLDKDQLTRAQNILGTKTIIEKIEQALTLVTEKATHDAIRR